MADVKGKLTDIDLKNLRIDELSREIQTLRKAVIESQKDCLALYKVVARLYEEKVKRLEEN